MKYKYDHIIKLLFEIHNWDKLPLYVPLNNKLEKNQWVDLQKIYIAKKIGRFFGPMDA